MGADNFKVNLSLKESIKLLDREIVHGSFTGERVDYHVILGDDNKGVIVLVYEKFYYRAGNRLSLTITIDNMSEITKVHSVGAGGGDGIFKFDWGASGTFTSCPRKILEKYIVK